MPRLTASLLAVLLVLAGASAAWAESQARWGYELANEIMSPFCPGRSLSECPSKEAMDLRAWILAQEEAGVSREAVEAELFGVWGDQLLHAPRPEGIGLWAYLVPAVAFLAGALLVGIYIWRQRAAADQPAPPPLAPVDPELERLVEEELRRA
jgi:cytochrome c-type biogenesis protein CcmH/NrfF